MLKIAQNKQLNQVSLTGIRALILLGLLIEQPRSLEEIKQIFIEYNIMDEDTSNDIIRIDINTLRTLGCVISKATPSSNNKYVLKKHIFSFDIEDDELRILKKAYNRVKESGNLLLLIQYDELFKKIINYIDNEETIEKILGISILKSFNMDLIKKLIELSNTNKIVKLEYKSPVSIKKTIKHVVIDDITLRNDKLYILGFDYDKKNSIMLKVKNILNIIDEYFNSEKRISNTVNVEFLIEDYDLFEIEENETIKEKIDNKYLVEGHYHNDFVAIQRILSLGDNCIVISPINFKDKIIEKLKKMKEIYKDG